MSNNNDLVQSIIEGIQERKGKCITHLNLNAIEGSSAQDFVVCTGSSTMQVSAIADSIREYVHENAKMKPYNYDGYKNSQWIVIDYGTVYVHVFLPEFREYYNLEQLWNDAVINNIPDLD